MKELQKILNKQERIFWEGKPRLLPYIFTGVLLGLAGLGLLSFSLYLFYQAAARNVALDGTFYLWTAIGLALLLAVPINTALQYRHTHYAITNTRILFQKGIVGRDFEAVDFDKITNADVNVGLLDVLFGRGTGSITVWTAGSGAKTKDGFKENPFTLKHVANPYGVFKSFKKISLDVKTDIHYPNEFRPKTNPGYRTRYTGSRTGRT